MKTVDRCAAGTKCAGWDTTAGAAPAAPDARLCADCVRLAAADITGLPDDHARLQTAPVDTGGGLSTRVSGHHEAPVPINLGADALARDIVWTLTVWEPAVREAAGLPPERTRGVRDTWAVATAASVIAPRVALMSLLPPAVGFYAGFGADPRSCMGLAGISALRRCHDRARGILGVARPVYRLPGDCSGCGRASLHRDAGADTVRCGGCGRRWSSIEYSRYVGMVSGPV